MNWNVINTIVGIVQIVVSLVLIASVLMQSAKKEGMAGIVGGASETFFGKNKGRTMDGLFATVTTVCAILFLVSSLFLTYGMTAVETKKAEKDKPKTEVTAPSLTVDENGNIVDENGNIIGSTTPAEGEVAPAEGEVAPAEGEVTPAEGAEAATPAEGESPATEGTAPADVPAA